MLAELSIRNIVLIERLDLRFPKGLTVLTGETGAGKSILLDAFALALGGRGDGALVRHGEAQGQVIAVFDVPAGHPARRLAEAAELDVEGDLILKRVQFADGRTRALVNDQPAGVQTLRAIGAALVEIHGQHADRALVDPASHRAILDGHAGLAAEARAVAEAARRLREARAALTAAESRMDEVRREREFLAHAVEELTALSAEPGEEAALGERRQLMQGAEKVAADLADAAEALAAPVPNLLAALRKLERRSGTAEAILARPVAALDALLVSFDEAEAALAEAVRAAEFDPGDLERTEERLFALRAAARKYACPADELSATRDRFAAQHAAIEAGEEELVGLTRAAAAAEAAYLAAAETLSASRIKAAAKLDRAVAAELQPLKLGRARLTTQVETDRTSRDPAGFDRVEFWVETNPGTRPGPLMKVASGGELSRFILALKVVLADKGSAPTLVFDEVDTGVGGAVSDAIGQRLARLAERVQVMAVTHAPQVAARASSHFLIAKAAAGGRAGRVQTEVSVLEPGSRREEIARMLAGAQVTEEARAAAGRLLEAGQV
ncbi:DNA repair protein RecN [Enterovirga sp.]|uniref:DNA repair protein RecN n=1 Tax=Enterovirga sp. TaxID=2026350 RepID=UPI0026322A5A|nr:DNA repair protein RecN [Enterovirga sp.]MDB5592750.1 repair protein RecN [Enterovirga sp.]